MIDLLAGVKLFNACYKELLKMNIENRAREYLAKHSEYSEVFGGTFIAVDTLTAMVEFSKQETKELEKENAELKKFFASCDTCKRTCDMGNCCKFGSDYLPDVEKILNKQKKFTKAKELLQKMSQRLSQRPGVEK